MAFGTKALAKDSILLVLICTGRDHAKFRDHAGTNLYRHGHPEGKARRA
jgi:hypothetical protein